MAEEKLKDELKRKRVLKGQFTKFKEKINFDEIDTAEADLILEKCKTFKEEFKLVFENIYKGCEEKAIDAFIEEEEGVFEKIEEIYLNVVRKLNKSENKLSKPEKTIDGLKLPKLSLPMFYGNLTEWITFKDLFQASVHKNPNLSNAQKLQYLKSSLKGDAYRIIQSISIADHNYEIAWDLLEERFSNKREQIFAQIKKLINISHIQTESAPAILNLVDNVNEIIRSLEIMGQTIENFSDTLIMFMILQKLDASIKLWWERQLKKDEIPKLVDLIDFLKDYARTIQNSKPSFNKMHRPTNKVISLITNTKCIFCEEDHNLQRCSKFLTLQVQKRIEFVKNNKLCFNCLSNVHQVKFCKSLHTCRHCSKHHHSILHIDSKFKAKVSPSHFPSTQAKVFIPKSQENADSLNAGEVTSTTCANNYEKQNLEASAHSNHILLCTALIKVKGSDDKFMTCRCLLDSGSEKSFIRRDCVNKLGLGVKEKTIYVSCLGTSHTVSKGEVNLLFTPHFNSDFRVSTQAFVIEKITGNIPHASLPVNLSNHFQDLMLADPSFCESGEIDILLGVNVFLTLINGEILKRGTNLPFALCSRLGWIISGTTSFEVEDVEHVSVNNLNINTENLIKSFWELEQIPTSPALSEEEKLCESHFLKNHTRDRNGRYSVKLPFKPEREVLGDSRSLALRKFLSLERRLVKNTSTYQQYKNFMSEYLSLGHMEEVPKDSLDKENAHFYIPHHPVIKESSLTTKLRVVFNASSKSSSGISLNDTLMNGAKVQDDLFAILLRFRCQTIAITGDLQKMFRQISIHIEDRDFQKILWRDEPSTPIKSYRLSTNTYGTTSASFLATRVLKQLAFDDGSKFPKATDILLHNCYVDDVLFGASTVDEAIELISELCELLQKGGFQLHKWCSNDRSILERALKSQDAGNSSCMIVDSKSIKVLGLVWQPTQDEFICDFDIPVNNQHSTKRLILSAVSKFWDPLGWLAPFIVAAKILIQEIWKFQVSWDDTVPEEINQKWQTYREQLSFLKLVRVPRRVLLPDAKNIELHCFCDSSEKAYAAVIYLRSSNASSISVKLLTAKTRVAPLKTISIPRLELCSAVLLTHLVQAVKNSLSIHIDSIYAWSDSMIVLSWLQSEPTRWQTFVANRVSEIQSVLPAHHWNHIKGKENPADCASRGLLPSELTSHELWWTGPTWLNTNEIPFSSQVPVPEDALKEERKIVSCSIGTTTTDIPIMTNVSSFVRLKRIIAWCFRFAHNTKSSTEKIKGFLTTTELKKARNAIVKIVQKQEFANEYHLLENKKELNSNSKILPLSPFVDQDGILRVGGRLRNANISPDRKYPILLPKKHRITEIIINQFHEKYLHAGPLLLLSVIRREFWIINARSVIRQQIWKCLKCHRLRAKTATQIMSDLPSSRVVSSKVFSKAGIDFAGPFLVKPRQGRGVRSVKCYICLFVCFTTKAVHIELVGNLTSDSFLAAFKRFVSRRGKPTEVFTDCGTNFVAANRELKRITASLKNDESVNRYCANENIRWNFNPPSAPHFGGLWEAAVKSTKFHLKRTIGEQVLTQEEFSTLLAQIEACLNSRPLCPMSDDPSEFSVLTPGHFLIGTPLIALPEENLTNQNIPIGQRWKLTQKMYQSFWKRWSDEYIATLQRRSKWSKVQPDIKVNDLVLMKEDNMSPLRWKLGRVIEVFPSADHRVRVVKLRTSTGIFKRPIHKLSVLPINN